VVGCRLRAMVELSLNLHGAGRSELQVQSKNLADHVGHQIGLPHYYRRQWLVLQIGDVRLG